MSTICCMLHLFGRRLGQKGSTLYVGAFCACAAGATARNPKQEIANAAAHVLVHLDLSIDNFFPSPLSSLGSLWLFSVCSVLNSEKLNTEVTEDHREPQRNRAAIRMFASRERLAVTRGDAASPCRLHFSGQIFGPVCRYPLHRCRCFLWSPWRSHRSNGTGPPCGRCRRSYPRASPLYGHGSRSCRWCRRRSARTFAAGHAKK